MGTAVSRSLGGRTIRLLALAVLAVVMVALLPPAAGTASSADDGRLSVIVRAEPGALTVAAREVERLGGQVGRQLRVINGFTAQLPPGQIDRLASSPGILSVTGNEPVQMQAAAYTPTTDAGSLYTTTVATGAQAYWKAGYTGKGIDVAVIDTGTAPVPGLDGAGKLVNGPDLVGTDVVGPDVVQRGLVGPDVVRAHVVGRDLDRAHVVRRRLVRQHLVQRRLELTGRRTPQRTRAEELASSARPRSLRVPSLAVWDDRVQRADHATELLLQEGKEVFRRRNRPGACSQLQLVAQADHAAAPDGCGGPLEPVRHPQDPGRVPVVEGGAEVGKVRGNPGQEALEQPAGQRRPVPGRVEPAKLGQPALVEHLSGRRRRPAGPPAIRMVPVAVEPAGQDRLDLGQQHRLGEVVVHARGQAPLPVRKHRRGHRDDRCAAGRPLTAADLGRGLVAVEDRQLAVHQHRPVDPSWHQFDGLPAIADHLGAVPELGEDGEGQDLVDLVVLDHQDPVPPVLGHQAGPGRGGALDQAFVQAVSSRI
jgi:hypothetical protein